MATGGIFLRAQGSLVVLQPSAYDSEAVLQTALAEFPEVIAGATTSGESEPRLLLITREMGVPSGDASGATFSLDHLFVDADCVPVFVEVKRASDTRIRREVVGQMLDYAANGVKYWPVEALQSALMRQAAETGREVTELVSGLDPDLNLEEFWSRVETNLKAGKVRLLFVADLLPLELVRIIEFLNEQMSPAEVLGVELQQFAQGEHIAYVPRVVGQTTAAASAKSTGAGQFWTKETFLNAASARVSEAEMRLINKLFTDVDSRGVKLNWGKGITPGVAGWYSVAGRPTGLWALNANTESPTSKAYLQLYLADLPSRVGSDVMEKAAAELERIPTLNAKLADARTNNWKKYPSLYLVDVAGHADQEQALLAAITVLITDSSAQPVGDA
jgi:hypothetical protein